MIVLIMDYLRLKPNRTIGVNKCVAYRNVPQSPHAMIYRWKSDAHVVVIRTYRISCGILSINMLHTVTRSHFSETICSRFVSLKSKYTYRLQIIYTPSKCRCNMTLNIFTLMAVIYTIGEVYYCAYVLINQLKILNDLHGSVLGDTNQFIRTQLHKHLLMSQCCFDRFQIICSREHTYICQ